MWGKMGDIAVIVAAMAAIIWLEYRLGRWRWSACKCGKEKLPYFERLHYKESFMWLLLFLYGFWAVYDAVTHDALFWTLWMGLLAVYTAKRISEHRKGKKSVLGRLLGRIIVNEHGRLAIDHAAG